MLFYLITNVAVKSIIIVEKDISKIKIIEENFKIIQF